jgi:uncharacterized membrane protein
MFDVVNMAKVVTAVTSLGGMVWVGADSIDRRPVLEYEVKQMADLLDSKLFSIQEQQIEIGKFMNSTRFSNLMEKLKVNGTLSFEEQQELCRIARELDYTGIPGCPNG